MHLKKSLIILFMVLIAQIIDVSALQKATYRIELGELMPIKDYATKKFKPYTGYYTVCEQDKSVVPLLISNLENKQNDYTLSLTGEKWASLPKKVSINANQKNLLFLSLFPPIDSSDTYIFMLDIINDKTGSKIKRDIPLLVEKCYDFALDVQNALNKSCGCEPYRTEFKLINNGKNNITVNLTLFAPEWINLEQGIADLAKDEVKQIGISGVVPCNESGNYNIGLTAHGIENKNIKSSSIFSLDALGTEGCSQAIIMGKDSYTISNKNQAIVLGLKNAGAKEAIYTLESSDDWLIITPNEINLKPDEVAQFRLKISSDFELREEHEATVIAKVGNSKYPKEIKLKPGKENIFSEEIVSPIISTGMYLEGVFYFYRYYFFTGLVIGGLVIVAIIFFRKKDKVTHKNN